MMDPTLSGQIGIVAVVIGGMYWLSQRYVEMGKKLDASAQACAEREAKLVDRLQALEDSRNSDLVNVVTGAVAALRETSNALQTNAATFQHWAEESGKHNVVSIRRKDITP